ncbi:type IX secretion system protein PorG [Prevotella sp.]|uniref:type IX secretion system protein PorG n=1 Tax=Prevotella sp. TaxID=59823 RepID=UPI00307BF9C6
MIKNLVISLACAMPSMCLAQSDYQYRMEIGAGVGVVTYQGDLGGSLTKNMQPMASVVLRRVFNPYMALKFSAAYGKLKGSSADSNTYYPDYAASQYRFNKTLVDAGVTYEYNFWSYGTGQDYRGAKRFTPFIFAGLGATYAGGEGNSAFTANVPIGLGVKYKAGKRLNVALEWAEHFSMSDKLDGVKDPYGIKSSGLFKNTDCYSAIQLTLTYSFMPKCRTCHNEDD